MLEMNMYSNSKTIIVRGKEILHLKIHVCDIDFIEVAVLQGIVQSLLR